MREIKFRAKKEGMKETWVEGSIVHITSTYKGEEDEQDCDIYQIIDEEGVGFYVDKKTIGQYTGLKDKNGKEIYEGDIVKYKFGYRGQEIIAPIKYGEWKESKCDEYDCVHYGYFIEYKWENYCENTGLDLYETNETLEVIGNIYDNKELLEEK